MAQHNNEYAKAWTDSEPLARALHGHEELSPSDQLALLVAQSADRLPLPGRGHTLQRWRALAEVAAHSLGLAKLYEGHTDALAILSELQADLARSEEHTSELQSPCNLVCRLLLEKK